jgi:hypothetical protein
MKEMRGCKKQDNGEICIIYAVSTLVIIVRLWFDWVGAEICFLPHLLGSHPDSCTVGKAPVVCFAEHKAAEA